MDTKRTFNDALQQNARVQLDWSGRGQYRLFFAIGTETYLESSQLSLAQMERVLYLKGYNVIDEQLNGTIKTFAKPDPFCGEYEQ